MEDDAVDELLQIDGLSHVYHTQSRDYIAIEKLSFNVKHGELVSIVGPSGCGKSTLLKCISGLMKATSGTVRLTGQQITDVPAGLAVIFQDYSRSLYPWMTVGDNVRFPLRGGWLKPGLGKREASERVIVCLESVGLLDHVKKYPWQLSGGMQQRVAIARAMAYRPHILLMDEPFASVDAQTRADLEDLVLNVRDEFAMTILFVTHDIDEAVYLSDRVLVLGPAPGTVIDEVAVDLPKPRDQIATRQLGKFISGRSHIARLIRSAGKVGGGSTRVEPIVDQSRGDWGTQHA